MVRPMPFADVILHDQAAVEHLSIALELELERLQLQHRDVPLGGEEGRRSGNDELSELAAYLSTRIDRSVHCVHVLARACFIATGVPSPKILWYSVLVIDRSVCSVRVWTVHVRKRTQKGTQAGDLR